MERDDLLVLEEVDLRDNSVSTGRPKVIQEPEADDGDYLPVTVEEPSIFEIQRSPMHTCKV